MIENNEPIVIEPNMSSERAQWLTSYLCELRVPLKLQDWDWDVEDPEPEGEDVIASVQPFYGRKYFRLRVAKHFFEASKETMRHTMTHELIHMHMAAAQRWVEEMANNGDITKHHYNAFIMNLEYGVDGLADALAPFLPLPTNPPA